MHVYSCLYFACVRWRSENAFLDDDNYPCDGIHCFSISHITLFLHICILVCSFVFFFTEVSTKGTIPGLHMSHLTLLLTMSKEGMLMYIGYGVLTAMMTFKTFLQE